MRLFNNINKFKNNLLLIDDDYKFYFKDLFKFEKKFKKIKKRKLALLLASNCSDFIKTYLTFLRKDVIVMLVDSVMDEDDIANIIKSYKPYYIFTKKKININLSKYKIFSKLNESIILEKKKSDSYTTHKDLCLLLTTSGSTGSKKFVRISKKNLYHNTKSICKYLKIKQNHRTITTLPPNYTFGLSILNTHIFSGASICLNKASFMEKAFWEKTNKFKINNFGGVPFNFEILKKLRFTKSKIKSLDYIIQAGGNLDIETKNYFLNDANTNKYKFIIMYGQVEATSRISYLPFEKLKDKLDSVGIPIPGGKLSINKNNEIIYEGPNVSLGYAKSYKDLKRGDDNKSKLYTGDLGKLDSDGYLKILGRKNRDIKLFGYRVNLDEIEKILRSKGYTCSCLGEDNKLYIFYIESLNIENISNFLSKKLKVNSKVFKFIYIDNFPLNSSGKISYTSLRKKI